MEDNILVGAIIGLLTTSTIFVYSTEKLTSSQKTILYFCILFAPLQWILIFVFLAYNQNSENNTVEKKEERKSEQIKLKVDDSISNLYNLKEKGILTDEEYNLKVEKLEAEKAEQDLKNSTEYKQLKSLLDSGVLTKEEFESKVEKLKYTAQKTFLNKYIEIKLLNGETLKVINNNNNIGVNNFLGLFVEIESNEIYNYYLNVDFLYVVKFKQIIRILKKRKITLKNKKVVDIYSQFDSVISKNDFVYIDGDLINDGKYELSKLKYFKTTNGKITYVSFFLNLI